MTTERCIEIVTGDRTGITAVVTDRGVTDARTVINHTRQRRVTYVAKAPGKAPARVTVREGHHGSFLYANWDGTSRNNLLDLGAFRSALAPRDHFRVLGGCLRVLEWFSVGYIAACNSAS